MKLSRRRFLTTGSGLVLGSSLGCKQVEQALVAGLRPPAAPPGPFTIPNGLEVDPVRHVIERLSFGPRPEDDARVRASATNTEDIVAAYIEQQLHPETLEDPWGTWAVRRLETLDEPLGELFEYQPELLLEEITRGTLLRATMSSRQLFEVMVHFWSDHFNIDASKGDCKWLKVADDREVVRRHALGSFADLLRASALSPAMLWYLDGRVNRKAERSEQPNENYARELLELHTLGIGGGYSQRDVMEVARCLTGWTVRSEEFLSKGKVEFQTTLHDHGTKEVLGHTIPPGLGAEDLHRVLAIVTEHPSTAHHLASKLCRRFIADEPAAATVAEVATAFTHSAGDLRTTLRTLFASQDFQHSTGQKFKRPFHFLVSALRATGANLLLTRRGEGRELYDYLLSMGHAPFQYPTPDGYPEEASPWYGTLLWRWNFATALAEGRLPGVELDLPGLIENLGGIQPLQAHLLGRQPTAEELHGTTAEAAPPQMTLALTLASPGFQRY